MDLQKRNYIIHQNTISLTKNYTKTDFLIQNSLKFFHFLQTNNMKLELLKLLLKVLL